MLASLMVSYHLLVILLMSCELLSDYQVSRQLGLFDVSLETSSTSCLQPLENNIMYGNII